MHVAMPQKNLTNEPILFFFRFFGGFGCGMFLYRQVTRMDYMFNRATAFVSDLSEWDVGKVRNTRTRARDLESL